MRSDQVFAGLRNVPNRFHLCRAAARATRLLHKPGGPARVQDTITDVIGKIQLGAPPRNESVPAIQESPETEAHVFQY